MALVPGDVVGIAGEPTFTLKSVKARAGERFWKCTWSIDGKAVTVDLPEKVLKLISKGPPPQGTRMVRTKRAPQTF